ncbi:MAG: hypothetical protein IKE85_02580 [Mogibacterium sp.]|nr:hypothetical protein [Mogibacterium sp.]
MKKGLSVLLIAAALFGFYGGAVNLNDVLACKDYWEQEGERSTADMNKLEDGLNQLKDNEQAYLDGLDQVADGEVALAEGEQTLEEGRATLAKGEADYAAAPAKLADGRKQIAQGEKDLAAGEKKLAAGYNEYNKGKADYAAAPAKLAAGRQAVSEGEAKLAAGKQAISGLDQLINGLTTAKNGFDQQWQPGFEMTDPTGANMGLQQGRQAIVQQFSDPANAKSIGLIEQMTGQENLAKNIDNESTYADFDAALVKIAGAFSAAKTQLEQFAGLASAYAGEEGDGALLSQAAAGLSQEGAASMTVAQMKGTADQLEKAIAAQKAIINDESATPEAKEAAQQALAQLEPQYKSVMTLIGARQAVATKLAAVDTDEFKAKLALVKGLDNGEALYQAIRGSLDKLEANNDTATPNNGEFAGAIKTLKTYLGVLAQGLNAQVASIDAKAPLLAKWHGGYTQLVAGKDQIDDPAKGVPFAFANMLSNPTIKSVLDSQAKALIPALQMYQGNKLDADDLDDFDNDMKLLSSNVIPNALQVLQGIKAEAQKQVAKGEKDLAAGKAELAAGEKSYKEAPAKLAAAEKQLAAGEKELAAGKKKLAAGKAEYAQGLADYKAAPAKLADGRAQLADGEKALAEGRQTLEDGKAKLAEYEDGEQQVRDGLATLMGTEANGGLTSIYDRRSGDDDFDNGDTHLDLDEGLEAVGTGREYQADSGALITKEITNRAIGTAAGLGAGALAVLAGILSFLKKNKGAGISAILAAAAGAAGVAVGTSAGMEFSSIAGSAVGATPWVAAGILAGVALVHAIVHFTGNKAA